MSIATAIANKQQQVADCYTAISNKGGTLPATQDVANMPTAINSISTGGTIDSLTITPSTSQQTITASGGVDGFSPITVNAVTSAIDANITAGNIKSGVSILGVSGSVTELNGETRTEQLDSTSGNTYTPTTGKNAITSITVTPKNYARTVAPQTTQSVWAVPSGYSGHGNITVSPVTSAIDANIQAGNIKSGVTILGVTGNYGGGSKYGATIDNLLGDVDANGVLQMPTRPSGDLVFTGVKDLGNYALYYRLNYTYMNRGVEFPDLEEVSGVNAMNNAFASNYINSISLQKLKVVSGVNALVGAFSSNSSPVCTSISINELETVSGSSGMRQCFQNNAYLTSFSMQKLKSVTGVQGLYQLLASTKIITLILPELMTANSLQAMGFICQSCSELLTVYLTKLTDISGSMTFSSAFVGCPKITDIYFNALTTTSFGSNINQFNNMFNSTTASTSGNVNIHLPSNLQNTIAGLTGYPLFGGASGRVTLLFDLPSTQ